KDLIVYPFSFRNLKSRYPITPKSTKYPRDHHCSLWITGPFGLSWINNSVPAGWAKGTMLAYSHFISSKSLDTINNTMPIPTGPTKLLKRRPSQNCIALTPRNEIYSLIISGTRKARGIGTRKKPNLLSITVFNIGKKIIQKVNRV